MSKMYNWLGKKLVAFAVSHQLYLSVFLTFYWSDYIIEKEPLVNKFISVPSDGGKIMNIITAVWFILDIKLHSRFKYIFMLLHLFICMWQYS